MVRILVFLAATTALAGCATQTRHHRRSAGSRAAPVVPDAPLTPKPQYGTYGFDAAGMDASVNPGDNFYLLPTAPG